MEDQQAQLLQIEQQVSSGTSLTTPGDDPVAAAQAVKLSATSATLMQYASNQNVALSSLQLEDNTLSSVTTTLQSVSSLLTQAGIRDGLRLKGGLAPVLRRRLMEYIDNRLAEPISLGELAAYAALSTSVYPSRILSACSVGFRASKAPRLIVFWPGLLAPLPGLPPPPLWLTPRSNESLYGH